MAVLVKIFPPILQGFVAAAIRQNVTAKLIEIQPLTPGLLPPGRESQVDVFNQEIGGNSIYVVHEFFALKIQLPPDGGNGIPRFDHLSVVGVIQNVERHFRSGRVVQSVFHVTVPGHIGDQIVSRL